MELEEVAVDMAHRQEELKRQEEWAAWEAAVVPLPLRLNNWRIK